MEVVLGLVAATHTLNITFYDFFKVALFYVGNI